MDDKEPKKKIQIGTIVHFERGKKSSSEMTTKSSEPIYADWTPELQKAQDKMIENFAKFVYEEMLKYIAAGGDLSKIKTKEGKEHFDAYQQKKIDEQNRAKKLREIKKKMTDEELEEFIKWKESIN